MGCQSRQKTADRPTHSLTDTCRNDNCAGQLHLHTAADEWLFVISAAEPLVSVTTLPNNTAVRVALAPGDSVLYPRGWPHYQLNPSCTQPATYHAVFPAQSAGTINLVANLGAAPAAYLESAFAAPPVGKGIWVLDAECERRCGRAG